MAIPYRTSPALDAVPGIRHGFFGRAGGVSTGDFASNNVSFSVGDGPANVAANRQAVADTLGGALVLSRQTHSTIVRVLTDPADRDTNVEADAMVTTVPGLLLGILTADCTPVLLADPEAGVIGAFHAGWKGAIGGIAQATVAAMTGLGADPARILAAIGPTISGANYEVGPIFAADLLAQHPAAASRLSTPPGGREHFDLPGFVADQLRATSVETIDDLKACTYADPAAYFSHRYATHHGTATGRQLALIRLG